MNVSISGALASAVLVGSVALVSLVKDSDEAHSVASPQVQLVYVAGNWTEPCKAAHQLSRSLADAAGDQLQVRSVHAVRERETMEALGVRVVPTFIVYDRAGLEIGRAEGHVTQEQLVPLLARAGVDLPVTVK